MTLDVGELIERHALPYIPVKQQASTTIKECTHFGRRVGHPNIVGRALAGSQVGVATKAARLALWRRLGSAPTCHNLDYRTYPRGV